MGWVRTKVGEYGKRYQIDLAYIIRSEFWVYLRQGVGLIAGLAITVIFARLAPKEVFCNSSHSYPHFHPRSEQCGFAFGS